MSNSHNAYELQSKGYGACIAKALTQTRHINIHTFLPPSFTHSTAPDSSPTNLTATPTSRSVTLQWSPPPVLSRNGILTHYVVVLANETWNITQSHNVTGEQRKRREADGEGDTQSYIAKDLTPFTNYTWEVTAVSDFGSGPTSDRRRFKTDQDG